MCSVSDGTDIVIPGVGVYNPRKAELEGEASRVRRLNVKQSIKRLTVHVHTPEDLPELLANHKMRSVEAITIDYIKGFSLQGLHQALINANFVPKQLQLFRVVGDVGSIAPWQVEEFGRLYRCLSGARLEICGHSMYSQSASEDDIVTREEHFGLDCWMRERGKFIATDGHSFPWFQERIIESRPIDFCINCENQFPQLEKLPSSVMRLTLYNVSTSLTRFSEYLRFLKLYRLAVFNVTTNDFELITENAKAIRFWVKRLPHLRGIRFNLNGERL